MSVSAEGSAPRANRHYVMFLDSLRAYADRLVPGPEPWQERVLRDIWRDGAIHLVMMAPTQVGRRIGLAGMRTFCEAAADRARPDVLFVYRIEPARPAGAHVPRSYVGEFQVFHRRAHPPQLDPLPPPFPATAQPSSATALRAGRTGIDEARPGSLEETLGPRPTPGLAEHLASASEEVRGAFRPNAAAPLLSDTEFLDRARALGREYRLERFIKSERGANYLNGRISRQNLGEDRELLQSLFSVALVEAFLRSPGERNLHRFLCDLGGFELPAPVRATLWAHTLYRLDATALLEELRCAAEGLLAMPAGDAITQAVLDAVTSVAQRTGDPVLVSLADSATTLGELLSSLPSQPSVETGASEAVRDPEAPSQPSSGLPDRGRTALAVPDVETPIPVTAPSADIELSRSSETPATAEPPIVITFSEGAGTEVAAVVDVSASESPPDDTTVSSSVEGWVLRYRNVSARAVTLRRELLPQLSRLVDLSSSSVLTLRSAQEVHGTLQELQRLVDMHSREWPSPATLNGDVQELVTALELTQDILGKHTMQLIRADISPMELIEIGELWKAGHGFVDFPSWVLAVGADGGNLSPEMATPTLLLDRGLRARLGQLVDHLKRSGLEDWSFLRSLPHPEGGDPMVHVEAAVAHHVHVAEQLSAAGEEYRRWLSSASRAGHGPQELESFLALAEALRGRIASEVFTQLLAALETRASESVSGVTLAAVEKAVEHLEMQTGSAHDATWRQIESIAQKEIQASSQRPAVESLGLRLNNNFVDELGTRVPLMFFRENGQPYAKLVVPLVLSAPRPISARLRLVVDTDLRSSWPGQWPAPTPSELQVQEASFRLAPAGEGREGRYVHTFKLVVPVKAAAQRQRGSTEAVTLKVTLTDAITSKVAVTRDLRWDTVETVAKPLHFNLPDATNPQYVMQHPTGPQNRVGTILDRIRNRSSFAILAPRRFGKTTLVEYLRQYQYDPQVHVGPVVLCTTYYDARGLDYERMWRYVSAELQKQLGSSIDPTLEDGLPRPDAFDHVRRAARARGKSSVLLLFDEAQLFFPKRRGWELGDRLKDLLERHWSRGDDASLAPLLFGFVGLPSFPERAGDNLCGMLRPLQQDEIQEKDLNKIILAATDQALHTTREARMRLARASRNLGVLRTLLEQLVQIAREEPRNWISYDDVVAIERVLYMQLREGAPAHGLAQWVRDAVNDAETINEWKPSPCYPVALALAQTRRTGRDRAQIVRAVEDDLNRWAGGLSPDKTLRAIYTTERVEEHLRTLAERAVIDKDLIFSTEMFEAWLLGQSRAGYPDNEAAQQALLGGAVMHIVMPDGAEEVGSGAQARVFRFRDGERLLALRRYRLQTKEDRQRFLDTVETLNILMKSRYRSEDGGDYVFELRNIGLNADDPMEAIQVYRWIEGESLDRSLGGLPPEIVVDIGVKLACALRLLHSYSILHRDVRPANIILARDGQRPVLIDFGLARVVAGESETSLGSEYAAPEVRGARPRWSKASDVFSLAATLQRLVRQSAERSALVDVLERAMNDNPEHRPSTEELLVELKKVAETLLIDGKKEEQWRGVLSAVRSDTNKRWYMAVVNKFQPQFVAMRMGFHPSAAERGADFADFLNQVLEAFPRSGGDRVTLGAVAAKGFGAILAEDAAIRCLHRLRNLRDHAQRPARNPVDVAQRLGLSSLDQLPAEVVRGTELLARELGLPSLTALARVLGLTSHPQ